MISYKDKNRNKDKTRNKDKNKDNFPKQLKSLSQVFLKDKEPVYDMIQFLKDHGIKRVLEIGPGDGILTESLLEQGFNLISIEKDPRFYNRLKERFIDSNLYPSNQFTLVNKDILDFSIKEWIAKDNSIPIAIVGNIPYSISSPLMYLLVPIISGISAVSFMVQKEFGDKVLTGDSPLKIIWKLVSNESKMISFVDRYKFDPVPQVDSCIIGFSIKSEDELNSISKDIDIYSFIKFLKTCFSLKRKKLSNVLKPFIKDTTSIKIDLNKRAADLSLEEFIELYKIIKK